MLAVDNSNLGHLKHYSSSAKPGPHLGEELLRHTPMTSPTPDRKPKTEGESRRITRRIPCPRPISLVSSSTATSLLACFALWASGASDERFWRSTGNPGQDGLSAMRATSPLLGNRGSADDGLPGSYAENAGIQWMHSLPTPSKASEKVPLEWWLRRRRQADR